MEFSPNVEVMGLAFGGESGVRFQDFGATVTFACGCGKIQVFCIFVRS